MILKHKFKPKIQMDYYELLLLWIKCYLTQNIFLLKFGFWKFKIWCIFDIFSFNHNSKWNHKFKKVQIKYNLELTTYFFVILYVNTTPHNYLKKWLQKMNFKLFKEVFIGFWTITCNSKLNKTSKTTMSTFPPFLWCCKHRLEHVFYPKNSCGKKCSHVERLFFLIDILKFQVF